MPEGKIHPKQIEIYRKLSGEKKVKIALDLSQLVREISQLGKQYGNRKRKRFTSFSARKA